MSFLNAIHNLLGLNLTNGLHKCEGRVQPQNKKLEKLFSSVEMTPDSIFYLGEYPFIVFYENPSDIAALSKTIWNINETPIVIVSQKGTITIYNGFNYDKNSKTLAVLGGQNELNNFEYFKLVTGVTWEMYETELSYKNRVDYKLLENIRAARQKLITECGLENHLANALLGKVIFIRYLIDRKVRLSFKSITKEWSIQDFCKILQSVSNTRAFFKYLERKFKGNLFEIDDFQNNIGLDSLGVVMNLVTGTEVSTGQQSLFDIYDFSIIPVEFISNVYEMFIGEREQAQSGAYYTPLFLVDYITTETIKNHFKLNPESNNCVVLDPACGSGIFLVEALRIIIEKYNNDFPKQSRGSKVYRNNLIRLTQRNIYGIDKDRSAISVALFSIYLTLLDYQSPRDIENFQFPDLLDKNFFTADFFNQKEQFNTALANISFDYIVGNPPWKRGGGKNNVLEPFEIYIKKRGALEAKNNQVSISNKEIAQAFLVRVSDFSASHTRTALVITSKTLYNLNAKDFRKYFLTNFFIDRVFELSGVRREVFDKSNDPAIAPATILFFRYAHGKSTRLNTAEHYSVKPNRFFSLFKLFLIQRNDIKIVQQRHLIDHDWIWKVLLYGNFNDFHFIKRLRDQYLTIAEEASKLECQIGQGVIINGNRELQDASHLIGKLMVRTKEDVDAFCINADQNNVWTENLALYPRDPNLFKAPTLLITEGITSEFRAVAAVNYNQEIVFKSSLTALRCDDVTFLETCCGFLNSSLFSYYALITTSSAGVEREQTHDKEKLGFPYVNDVRIAAIVNELHLKKEKLRKAADVILSHEKVIQQNEINKLLPRLDKLVYKAFELNDIEKALVDYATRYSIPSIMKSKTNNNFSTIIKYQDNYLLDYINIFRARFTAAFESKSNKFVTEIWHSDHIIGIFFRIIPGKKSISNEPKWTDKSYSEFLKLIVQLGHTKISDRLFMQKDIRGFEKESFYIFKPNDKKVWHNAMAYLDLNDFVDAILKVGGDA